jgi:hypothetical protein
MSDDKTKQSKPVRADTAQDKHKLEALLRNEKLPSPKKPHEDKWWYRRNGAHKIWP